MDHGASAIAESKANLDFFSLPAETRNQIYQLLLEFKR